jgi:hypothetical protein
MFIDVFNGDADGIFALIQLRKANPVSTKKQSLLSGPKRDVSLLNKITNEQANGACISVLDISFDKNSSDVERLLNFTENIFYCDHHQANSLFTHSKLSALINNAPDVCTSLLINDFLKGSHVSWAISAAYGDGLDKSASKLANAVGISEDDKNKLKQLGMLVNYNGYGAYESDLFFRPTELYQLLFNYENPFDVIADVNSPYSTLRIGYDSDLSKARDCSPVINDNCAIAIVFDNEPWAARISGSYGNLLAEENPNKAVIVSTINDDKTLKISLRAPKNSPRGAAQICSQFESGGGRESAAGINRLNLSDFDRFVYSVNRFYTI